MLVKDVMTSAVVTAEPASTIGAAARLLHEGRFRHLPVVANGRLVGIVSDRDLTAASLPTVGDIMHSHVITTSPGTPIEAAASLLAENKIGALPVVDASTDTLVGIISQTDLFVVLARLMRGEGPSTRLELHMLDLPRELAAVAGIAQQQRVGITSLVTIPPPGDGRRHTVIVRVGTIDPRPFITALRDAGIEVAPTAPDLSPSGVV